MNKIIISSLMIAIALMGCRRDMGYALCPTLNNKVKEYINTKSKAGIIFLTFSSVNGRDIVSIHDGVVYDGRETDYYFKMADKLIVIYSTDYKERDQFFNKDSMNVFKGDIPGYYNKNATDDNLYESNYLTTYDTFILINQDSIIEYNADISVEYIAKDNNVITNKEINDTINAYINERPSALYLLKFKKIDGHLFFVFENAQYYDTQDISGYFMRNNHVIAVYNSSEANCIAQNEFIKSEKIDGFKHALLDIGWLLNRPICYRIENSGKITKFTDIGIQYKVISK